MSKSSKSSSRRPSISSPYEGVQPSIQRGFQPSKGGLGGVQVGNQPSKSGGKGTPPTTGKKK